MANKKTHYEYLPLVMHRYDEEEGKWSNAKMTAFLLNNSPFHAEGKPSSRYCKTMKEAKMYIDWLVKEYKPIGKKVTRVQRAGGIGITWDDDVESQKRREIVKYCIKRREVTDYEVVSEWSKKD